MHSLHNLFPYLEKNLQSTASWLATWIKRIVACYMIKLQSGMVWHKTIFWFFTMILPLSFLGQRHKPLSVNHQWYPAFVDLLPPKRKGVSCPSPHKCALLHRTRHLVARLYGRNLQWGSGKWVPAPSDIHKNSKEWHSWVPLKILCCFGGGTFRSDKIFLMLPDRVLCKSMWGKGELQTNVKGTADFTFVSIKYFALMED